MSLHHLQRLRASQLGRAVPIATRRHVHLSEHPLVIVGYHLAGDLGAVVALMWGSNADLSTAQIVVVPEPRDRQLRFDALQTFGDAFSRYLAPYHQTVFVPSGRSGAVGEICVEAPQIVVPNIATADWLTGIVGRFTRTLAGHDDVPPAVPLAGTNLSFFADPAHTPGSSLLLAATEALRIHFATGQTPAEDLDLASLRAWIAPLDGLDGPQAARMAENGASAGPISEPRRFDRNVLEPVNRRWHEAADDDLTRRRVRRDLIDAAREELASAWRHTWSAIEDLRALPVAAHVAERWARDRQAWTNHVARLAADNARFAVHHRPVSLARGVRMRERRQDEVAGQMALDDPLIMARAVASGVAVHGRVTAIGNLIDASPSGRPRTRPTVTIAPDMLYAGALGTRLCLASNPEVVVDVHARAGIEPDAPLTMLVTSGALRPKTRYRLPAVGDTVVFSPWPKELYPDRIPGDEPWTHRLPQRAEPQDAL